MTGKHKLLWIDHDPALYGSNHIGMFDLTKGIFMVMIILLHCINDYFSPTFYYGGDSIALDLLLSPLTLLRYGSVPMLFMCCGYGIRRQAIKKNVNNNLKLFILPYACVIFGVSFCVVTEWLICGGSLRSRLIYQVFPFFIALHPGTHLLKGAFAQIGPVWFFFTYIFASIYLNIVLQEKRVWVQAMILLAGVAAALIMSGTPLPFCLQQIAICAGFMYIGMQLKRWKIPQQKLSLPLLIIVYILCALSTMLGGTAEIGNNIYRFGGADLLIACLSGIILLCLFLRLNVLQGSLADALRWTGRHMMWLCCIHTVSYLMGPWNILAAYFASKPIIGLLLEIIISFVFAFFVCFLLDIMFRKRPRLKKRNSVFNQKGKNYENGI